VKTRLLACAALTAAAVVAANAQEPIPVGARVGSAPASGYDDMGRRDPFVSLITPKKIPGTTTQAKPASGLGALAVNDVLVTGIMTVNGDPIALLQGPDGKSFPTKKGDKLRDGVVKRIDRDAVVFAQQEEDVLGVMHPKETRKPIRTSEGAGK